MARGREVVGGGGEGAPGNELKDGSYRPVIRIDGMDVIIIREKKMKRKRKTEWPVGKSWWNGF